MFKLAALNSGSTPANPSRLIPLRFFRHHTIPGSWWQESEIVGLHLRIRRPPARAIRRTRRVLTRPRGMAFRRSDPNRFVRLINVVVRVTVRVVRRYSDEADEDRSSCFRFPKDARRTCGGFRKSVMVAAPRYFFKDSEIHLRLRKDAVPASRTCGESARTGIAGVAARRS